MNATSAQRADVTRFHLSLNVNNLEKSVRFLTALFGCEPIKYRVDYAKFEPDDLPLVLSLEPRTTPQAPLRNTAGEGPLNHVGIRMTDMNQLLEVQRRIEAVGYSIQREDGVECCYARQTKFWVHDNDHTMWEVYVLDEDLDHRGIPHDSPQRSETPSLACPAAPRNTWSHRMAEDFPDCIPGAGELDEVVLQGTWNANKHTGRWASQLAQIQSALRPGGKLVLHFLTSNEPINQLTPLPGRAAVVEVVPLLSDVISAVESSGFVNLQLVKYGSSPCFTQEGVEMRETRIEAYSRRSHSGLNAMVRVMYKGPLAEIRHDCLGTLSRGVVTLVPMETWEQLARSELAESFVTLSAPQQKSVIACLG